MGCRRLFERRCESCHPSWYKLPQRRAHKANLASRLLGDARRIRFPPPPSSSPVHDMRGLLLAAFAAAALAACPNQCSGA